MSRDMSQRVIKWGVKPPQPENPAESTLITRICKYCKKAYSFYPYKGGARKSCDECLHNKPKEQVTRKCLRCGSTFQLTPKRGTKVKLCPECKSESAVRKGAPGDSDKYYTASRNGDLEKIAKTGAFLELDRAIATASVTALLDDFKQIDDDFLLVSYEQELDWILTEVKRSGFVWGHSATQLPRDSLLLQLAHPQKNGPPIDIWTAIENAEPIYSLVRGAQLSMFTRKLGTA